MTRLIATAAVAALSLSAAIPGYAATKPAKVPAMIAATPADKAQVVFYRPGGSGMAIRCTVRDQGKMIGRVGNGKYFTQTFTPGKYSFTTKTESTDTLTMELESGETYYVKCKIGMGLMSGRPNLSPSTKAEFDARSAKLKVKTAEDIAKEAAEDAADAASGK